MVAMAANQMRTGVTVGLRMDDENRLADHSCQRMLADSSLMTAIDRLLVRTLPLFDRWTTRSWTTCLRRQRAGASHPVKPYSTVADRPTVLR